VLQRDGRREGQSSFTVANRNALIPFRWTNGQIVGFCPSYERHNVSFTAGNVETTLGVAVFLPHPEMSCATVG
jgi:hypothetical protein